MRSGTKLRAGCLIGWESSRLSHLFGPHLSFASLVQSQIVRCTNTSKVFVCFDQSGGTKMFELLIESTRNKKRGRRWTYFLATSAVWMMTFTAVIIAGIVVVDAQLGESVDITRLITPPPPLAPKGKSNDTPQRTNKPRENTGFVSAKNIPQDIPQPQIKPPTFDPPSGPTDNDGGVDGGDPHGDPDGVIGGLPPSSASTPPPPTPQPRPDSSRTETPTQPQPQKQIVRSVILQGTAVNRVQPPYPPLARTANVSGAVVVEVTIDEQGNVVTARVLSGHPLLREASLNAARGWKWKPTMLNGSPVKVIGTITFNFQK